MEDYMKTIYRLSRLDGGGLVHISAIAAAMGIKKASACRATDALAEKGLLQKDRYKGLCFTEQGLRYVLFIVWRYTVITRFLHEALGVDLDIAREDACGVEHVISGQSYQAICAFLGERAAG
ncbi:MAG: metal-dependent transcriptional regulator [Oscillospiraceae bacterium]|nr:metal-dependent transcriptional regulator [Oscillospiraceae bacterium]